MACKLTRYQQWSALLSLVFFFDALMELCRLVESFLCMQMFLYLFFQDCAAELVLVNEITKLVDLDKVALAGLTHTAATCFSMR